MNAREIPGYFYDTEKRKYFKIEKNQHTPANFKYSANNIKKEGKRVQAEKDAQRRSEHKKKVIRHPVRNVSTPLRAHLHREIGYQAGSFYAEYAWSNAVAAQYEAHSILRVGGEQLRQFVRDQTTGCLYISRGINKLSRLSPQKDAHPTTYHERNETTLMHMTSDISSLGYFPGSGTLVATTLGSHRPPVIYITQPEVDGPAVGEQFMPPSIATIWCSALWPSHQEAAQTMNAATGEEYIAVGASKQLMLLQRSNSSPWTSTTPLRFDSDVLALDWLSPTVLALGCRDGNIHVYDRRSSGSSQILRHTTAVSHILHADDFTRLVVKGLRNTLMLYDMRMARSFTSPHTTFGRKNRREFSSFTRHSRYLTRFPYANDDFFSMGIDLHRPLGLLAAADEANRIQLWNVRTGDVVKTFQPKQSKSPRSQMRTVRFLDEDGDVSVWAGHATEIVRYGC